MKIFRFITVLLAYAFVSVSSVAYSYPLAPSPDYTNGQLCNIGSPDFSGYRYVEGIPYCERNVPWMQKERIYNLYKIPKECRHRYTVDHFIPLAIGGDNSDENLWPEHKLVKATRPHLEQQLYLAISKGQITQKKAIELIVREKTDVRGMSAALYADICDKPTRY